MGMVLPGNTGDLYHLPLRSSHEIPNRLSFLDTVVALLRGNSVLQAIPKCPWEFTQLWFLAWPHCIPEHAAGFSRPLCVWSASLGSCGFNVEGRTAGPASPGPCLGQLRLLRLPNIPGSGPAMLGSIILCSSAGTARLSGMEPEKAGPGRYFITALWPLSGWAFLNCLRIVSTSVCVSFPSSL